MISALTRKNPGRRQAQVVATKQAQLSPAGQGGRETVPAAQGPRTTVPGGGGMQPPPAPPSLLPAATPLVRGLLFQTMLLLGLHIF